MNFNSIFEELSELYDEDIDEGTSEDVLEEAITNEYKLVNKQGVAVVKDVFGSKEEAAAYANKHKITDVKIARTELVDGEYNGHYEYGIDENGNITEGIFDSKATKQKKYQAAIKEVFGKDYTQVRLNIAGMAAKLLSETADEISSQSASTTDGKAHAKNVISTLKTADKTINKFPQSFVRNILDLARKFNKDSTIIPELEELLKLCRQLQNSNYKAMEYLFELVNKDLKFRVDTQIKSLKNKYHITESASGTSDEVDSEEATEEVDIEIVDDAPTQLVLECAKCGALVIKDKADVVVDEKSDLVNIEEACAFCEETEGYKIIGMLTPYENMDNEELEEFLDASIKLDAQNFAGSDNKVSVLGLGEDLDEDSEEELEEFLDADITLDARGFGGSGNDVSIL